MSLCHVCIAVCAREDLETALTEKPANI